MLSKFIDRFRGLTMIAHMGEKWRILPVVHHASSLQTSTWRLDPELKIVNLNKQLPYSKVSVTYNRKYFLTKIFDQTSKFINRLR